MTECRYEMTLCLSTLFVKLLTRVSMYASISATVSYVSRVSNLTKLILF